MKQILGIIGGGQLGMMLTEAAKKLSEHVSEVIVLDPTKNCPASTAGAKQIVADFKDEKALTELALQSDVLTYEIESGDGAVLKTLEKKTKINPSPKTLAIIQDKLKQKEFLSKNQLPVVEFTKISSLDDLKRKLKKFDYPALLKARKGAYDGRGNFRINSQEEIETAYEYFKGNDMMLEKFLDFKMEVSIIAVRSTTKQIAVYPLVENIHEENILKMTIAPARVSKNVARNAEELAKKTMEVLSGAGVFGIEMFLTKGDELFINEIAPRVHNSGHHTLHSSKTSQFEQHVRSVIGLKLGSTELLHSAVMCNILGPKNFHGKYEQVKIDTNEGIFLKMYNKADSKPQRKLGHFTVIDIKDTMEIEEIIDIAHKINNGIKIKPIK